MTGFRRSFDRAASLVETLAALCLAVVTVTVFVSALGRYFFATPIPDAFDVSRLLLGLAIAWGFAVLGLRGGHICVDILAEALPARPRQVIEIVAQLVLLGFSVLLAWKIHSRFDSALQSGEATFDLRLAVWPFIFAIWLGFAASVLTTFAGLILLCLGQRLDPFERLDDPLESGAFPHE
ncbi:TRAP transporter small permease [Pseudooceanicola sediminis]|uniref:TRAP transporter small permease protein n=1 Tax=Pseudooceanicola sediminis TaxID=2211117 RepID=A0A399J2H2_9RHOB|nr:TRAP transporter small permease [Pseudooceanicola sediminis]KAA2317279.1 TRAP transporter small permease [Puniceibacterium sp. HSS470]RII39633.1 TRAP transporter small permease [Pseudooceanicola sediminis]